MDRELAARFDTPRERLLGVFEVQGLSFTEPGFRGCAFVGANAESSAGTSVEELTEDYRNWVRALFVDLAKEAGAIDPVGLARHSSCSTTAPGSPPGWTMTPALPRQHVLSRQP
jgi:hypothetical protein